LLNRNDFDANPRIYVGALGDESPSWLKSKECVWNGPSWLRVKRRLDTEQKYGELQPFFQLTLGIGDATWNDALEELIRMKASGNANRETVGDIYQMLWREFEQDQNNGASIR